MDSDGPLDQLEQNLRRVREWRERASAEFDAAINGLTTGRPDRNERVRAASKEYSRALEAVNVALKEYNDWLMKQDQPTPRPREKA